MAQALDPSSCVAQPDRRGPVHYWFGIPALLRPISLPRMKRAARFLPPLRPLVPVFSHRDIEENNHEHRFDCRRHRRS